MSLAPSPSAAMKPPRGKLPISIITIVICGFAFVALLYADTSRSFFKLKSCPRRHGAKKSSKFIFSRFCQVGFSLFFFFSFLFFSFSYLTFVCFERNGRKKKKEKKCDFSNLLYLNSRLCQVGLVIFQIYFI